MSWRPTLADWRAEFREFGNPSGLGFGLVNSLIVALLTSALSIALGGATAYGLRLMGRRHPLVWPADVFLLLPRFVPAAVLVAPFSIMMNWLGLTDTLAVLIIAHTCLAMPLAVLILCSALKELPADVFDAAQTDGCGALQAFLLVTVPLLAPALLAAGVLCFARSWNEFLFALINMKLRARTAPPVDRLAHNERRYRIRVRGQPPASGAPAAAAPRAHRPPLPGSRPFAGGGRGLKGEVLTEGVLHEEERR